MKHFILFRRLEARDGTPIGVYDSMEEAERAKFRKQQAEVMVCNIAREDAYLDGKSFRGEAMVDEFAPYFSITRVQDLSEDQS